MYGAFFGRGVGPVHMTSVGCHGNEENLTECSYISGIGVDNCYHGKDVGVICLGKEKGIKLQKNFLYYYRYCCFL